MKTLATSHCVYSYSYLWETSDTQETIGPRGRNGAFSLIRRIFFQSCRCFLFPGCFLVINRVLRCWDANEWDGMEERASVSTYILWIICSKSRGVVFIHVSFSVLWGQESLPIICILYRITRHSDRSLFNDFLPGIVYSTLQRLNRATSLMCKNWKLKCWYNPKTTNLATFGTRKNSHTYWRALVVYCDVAQPREILALSFSSSMPRTSFSSWESVFWPSKKPTTTTTTTTNDESFFKSPSLYMTITTDKDSFRTVLSDFRTKDSWSWREWIVVKGD